MGGFCIHAYAKIRQLELNVSRNAGEYLGQPAESLTAPQSLLAANTLATRVGTLIVATIYLQLIQNRYMFRSFTVLQCSHQHCVQPVASYVEVV